MSSILLCSTAFKIMKQHLQYSFLLKSSNHLFEVGICFKTVHIVSNHLLAEDIVYLSGRICEGIGRVGKVIEYSIYGK